MTNQNRVWAAVAALIILIGGSYLARHQIRAAIAPPTPQIVHPIATVESIPTETIGTISPTPTPPTTTINGTIEVDYDGSTFIPEVITIKKGTVVVFVNKSKGEMSVASNPHPTHTDLPGFDQFKSADKGKKTYTYTFVKVGTWGYHNHLNPPVTGKVIVTE